MRAGKYRHYSFMRVRRSLMRTSRECGLTSSGMAEVPMAFWMSSRDIVLRASVESIAPLRFVMYVCERHYQR